FACNRKIKTCGRSFRLPIIWERSVEASLRLSPHPSMNAQTSHDRLWQKRVDALAAVWPAVLDGETKALHKARVASRRIREALPVVAVSAPPAKVKKLRRRLRDLTRTLGPVRELDVELGM